MDASGVTAAEPGCRATMLSNHDRFAGRRVADQLGNDLARMELAAGSDLLLPGTPFIYDGTEVGMAGSAAFTGEASQRTPMSWSASTVDAGFSTATPYRGPSANVASHNVATELADPGSLSTFYKALLALRNSRPSIAAGSYEAASANGLVMSFQRASGAQRTLVVINDATSAGAVDVGALPVNATLSAPYPADRVAAAASAGGVAHLSMAAQQVRVFDVTP